MKSFHVWSFSAPYSVQMRENTDKKNSEYGHFSRSVYGLNKSCALLDILLKLLIMFGGTKYQLTNWDKVECKNVIKVSHKPISENGFGWKVFLGI